MAYPLLFESLDDAVSLYHQSGSVTVSLASPATITWAAHKLAIGAPVVFSGMTNAAGITAGTVYYVATTNFTTGSFELSTTFNAAGNVNTSSAGSGTCACVSRIYAAEDGDYLFNLSSVVKASSNTDATADVWFVKGNLTDNLTGTNVPKSNTQVGLVSTGEQMTVSVPFVIDLLAGDFIRLDYCMGANISWFAAATAINPTRPAMPSVIISVNKIGS